MPDFRGTDLPNFFQYFRSIKDLVNSQTSQKVYQHLILNFFNLRMTSVKTLTLPRLFSIFNMAAVSRCIVQFLLDLTAFCLLKSLIPSFIILLHMELQSYVSCKVVVNVVFIKEN